MTKGERIRRGGAQRLSVKDAPRAARKVKGAAKKSELGRLLAIRAFNRAHRRWKLLGCRGRRLDGVLGRADAGGQGRRKGRSCRRARRSITRGIL